jgi:hypothetical protein
VECVCVCVCVLSCLVLSCLVGLSCGWRMRIYFDRHLETPLDVAALLCAPPESIRLFQSINILPYGKMDLVQGEMTGTGLASLVPM